MKAVTTPDEYEFMARVEIEQAQTLDRWASEHRKDGELHCDARKESFKARKRAREMMSKAGDQLTDREDSFEEDVARLNELNGVSEQ